MWGMCAGWVTPQYKSWTLLCRCAAKVCLGWPGTALDGAWLVACLMHGSTFSLHTITINCLSSLQCVFKHRKDECQPTTVVCSRIQKPASVQHALQLQDV